MYYVLLCLERLEDFRIGHLLTEAASTEMRQKRDSSINP